MKYEYTLEQLRENVRLAYERTRECTHCARQDADNWYFQKGAWIREQVRRYGLDLGMAFDIYALLSMNSTVEENDRMFLRYLRKQRVGHFDNVKQRITWVRKRDPRAMTFKNAAKVLKFSPTLRYPHRWADEAVLDRWSGRVATNGHERAALAILSRANLAGYKLMEQAYIDVAHEVGVRVHQVQAPTWVHERDQHERLR